MEPDPNLLSQMGFASFGASSQSKKRKFNPRADATSSASIEVQERADSRRNQDKATGGNRMALGSRKPAVAPTSDSSTLAKPVKSDDTILVDVNDDDGPRYTDETPPPMNEAEDITGVNQDHSKSSIYLQTHNSIDDDQSEARIQEALVSQPAMPIERPKSPVLRDGMTRSELAAYRRGLRNDRGDMVYYDSSFIEDPWARLTG